MSACGTLAKLYPDTQDEIITCIPGAQIILYDRAHFVDAAHRFGEIIDKFGRQRSRDAAGPHDVRAGEPAGVAGALHAVAAVPREQAVARPSSQPAWRVVEGSHHHKWVRRESSTSRRRTRRRRRKEVPQVRQGVPKSENADQALTYAMSIAQETGELDRGIEAGGLLASTHTPFDLKVLPHAGGPLQKCLTTARPPSWRVKFISARRRHQRAGVGRQSLRSARAEARAPKARPRGRTRTPPRATDSWPPSASCWWTKQRLGWRCPVQRGRVVGERGQAKAVAAYSAYVSLGSASAGRVPQVAWSAALVWEKERTSGAGRAGVQRLRGGFGRDSTCALAALWRATSCSRGRYKTA